MTVIFREWNYFVLVNIIAKLFFLKNYYSAMAKYIGIEWNDHHINSKDDMYVITGRQGKKRDLVDMLIILPTTDRPCKVKFFIVRHAKYAITHMKRMYTDGNIYWHM